MPRGGADGIVVDLARPLSVREWCEKLDPKRERAHLSYGHRESRH